MEDDLTDLANDDIKLLYDTFKIILTGNYDGSEV